MVRDALGNCIATISILCLSMWTLLTTALMAIYHGLSFCIERNLAKCKKESDFLNAIQMVKREDWCLATEDNIVDQIMELIGKFSEIQFSYSPRECNKIAHMFARQALSFMDK